MTTGLRVTALNVFSSVSSINDDEEIECDLTEQNKKEKLVRGYYNLLFAHPEALISSKFGREMVYSATYQQHVCSIVIDEAHCIIEWCDNFFKLKFLIVITMTHPLKHRHLSPHVQGIQKCISSLVPVSSKNVKLSGVK